MRDYTDEENIYEILQRARKKNKVPFSMSFAEVKQSIDNLFPMVISISDEFKHTKDDQKKGKYITAQPWHYEEVLEKLNEFIAISYCEESNRFNFGLEDDYEYHSGVFCKKQMGGTYEQR